MPVVFYQPETGVGYGVAANYYVRLTGSAEDRPDRAIPPSSFQLIGVYTAKSQIVTLLKSELFLGVFVACAVYAQFSVFIIAFAYSKFFFLGRGTVQIIIF